MGKQKKMGVLRPHRKHDLLELKDVEERMKPFQRVYLGVRAVPLASVVGTEGRAGAFTRDFKPRHDFSRERLRSLAEAFPDGGYPTIVAVKLGDTYFVIDGHHRVALAHRQGSESIDAEITEFVSRVPLPAGADMLEVVLRQLERVFLEESGLAEARSGTRLAASRPAVYLELLENIQVHGYNLMRDRLGRDYRDAPDADLFLMLHHRRREGFPSAGCPSLEETARLARGEVVKPPRFGRGRGR